MSSMLRTGGGAGLDSALIACALVVAVSRFGAVAVLEMSSMLLTGDCAAGELIFRRGDGFLDA